MLMLHCLAGLTLDLHFALKDSVLQANKLLKTENCATWGGLHGL